MSNYLPKLMDVTARLLEVQDKPGLFNVDIAHDDWCALLNGKGDCNCDPEIEIRPVRTGKDLS